MKQYKRVYKCVDCGEVVFHNLSKRCVRCANLHKAKVANEKSDRRAKRDIQSKVIKLKCGLTVINNCFGQVMAGADKVWFSSNG